MIDCWNKQASAAFGYSLTRLALNYYTYFEIITGGEQRDETSFAEPVLHQLIGAFLNGEQALTKLSRLRESVGKEMETVTAYADCFRIYEYALNRMERRFETDIASIEQEEDAFVAQLMHFLTDVKDTAMMNQRIQMVIGQLPIRFTRQKFYSMVLDALSIYVGSDQSGLDNMMYLLQTGAAVALDQESESHYKELKRLLDQLRGLSFQELDAGRYRESIHAVTCAGEVLYRLSDEYVLLQDLVNDLYVLFLTGEDAVKDAREEANARRIIDGIYRQLEYGKSETAPDEIEEQLYLLEGVQERYYDKYQRLPEAPAYKAGEAEEGYRGRCVDKLLSASPFVSLEEVPGEKTVTRADVETAANGFFTQLDLLFAVSQKPVIRAIMATTLSVLPVCFHSLEEIRSYIVNSLSSCTDSKEKETCMELLRQIMET